MSNVIQEPTFVGPPKSYRRQTELVRGGLERSDFLETAEAIYMTSGYVYRSAEEAEAAFKGNIDRYIYGRYGNPTVTMFEERLRTLEGAEACRATASRATWARPRSRCRERRCSCSRRTSRSGAASDASRSGPSPS